MAIAKQSKPQAVFCFSGFDPSGGAGLTADVQTLQHFGVHCCAAITCNTVQNFSSFSALNTQQTNGVIEQFVACQQEFELPVIKLGLMPHSMREAVLEKLTNEPNSKQGHIVLDPVEKASSDKQNASQSVFSHSMATSLRALNNIIITPNLNELDTLASYLLNAHEKQNCANTSELACLLSGTYELAILLTTTDAAKAAGEPHCRQTLFINGKMINSWQYALLDGNFHGSGCTLASIISALIFTCLKNNQNINIEQICAQALEQCYGMMQNAWPVNAQQLCPQRL